MLLCLEEFGDKLVTLDSRIGSEFVDRRVGRVAAASGERLAKGNLSKEKNLLIPDGGLPVFSVREALPGCCGLCSFDMSRALEELYRSTDSFSYFLSVPFQTILILSLSTSSSLLKFTTGESPTTTQCCR